MKQVFIALALMLSASASFADKIVCKDSAGPEEGFQIRVSDDLTEAKVEMKGFAGGLTLAKLKCAVNSKPPVEEDRTWNLLVCQDPSVRDAGYVVFVQTQGFNAGYKAYLNTVSIAGSTPISEMKCRFEH